MFVQELLLELTMEMGKLIHFQYNRELKQAIQGMKMGFYSRWL